MKKVILFSISIVITAYIMAAGLMPALTLQKTSKTVVPDGVINTDGSEVWTTTWIELTDQKASNTTNKISARFQMAYNNYYLWIALQQSGNSQIDTSYSDAQWERDNFVVNIGVDTNSFAHKGRYGEGDLDFFMNRGVSNIISPYNSVDNAVAGLPVDPYAFDDGGWLTKISVNNIAQNNNNFKIGQVELGNGVFQQEWQIPWSGLIGSLKDSGIFLGNYFKFEVEADDCTTPGNNAGRTQQIYWHNNSDNEWQDTRTFSLIYLATSVVESNDSSIIQNPLDSLNNIISNIRIHLSNLINDSTSMANRIINLQDSILYTKFDTSVINVTIIDMQDVSSIIGLSGTNVSIRMFPNPVNDKLTIESNVNIEKYEIYSSAGILVNTENLNSISSQIDIKGFEDGIYFMKLYTLYGNIGCKMEIFKNNGNK